MSSPDLSEHPTLTLMLLAQCAAASTRWPARCMRATSRLSQRLIGSKGTRASTAATRFDLEDGAAVETDLLAPEQVDGRTVIDSGSLAPKR